MTDFVQTQIKRRKRRRREIQVTSNPKTRMLVESSAEGRKAEDMDGANSLFILQTQPKPYEREERSEGEEREKERGRGRERKREKRERE